MNKSFGWFKSIFNVGKQKTAAQIDGAEHVTIDSSALHCPVCFQIFTCIPIVLPCGHSFCKLCIRRLIDNSFKQQDDINPPGFECALCRKICSSKAKLTKNYVVDAILQSVCEMALEDKTDLNSNIKFSLKRCLLTLNDYEKKVSKLERAVEEEKRRSKIYFQMSFFCGTLLSIVLFYYIRFFF